MTPTESLAAFNKFAASRGVELSSGAPREGLEAMLAFFETQRAENCDGPDADMLLYQWGTYDWGNGRHFEINITRQFIESGLEDDDAISQLGLTYKFSPSQEFDALAEGNRWCRAAGELASFRAFVLASAPFVAVADARPSSVDQSHFYV